MTLLAILIGLLLLYLGYKESEEQKQHDTFMLKTYQRMTKEIKFMTLTMSLRPGIKSDAIERIKSKLKLLQFECRIIPINKFLNNIEIDVPTYMQPNDVVVLGALIGQLSMPQGLITSPVIKRHETTQQIVNKIEYHTYMFTYEEDHEEIPYVVIMSKEGWEMFKRATGWKLHREETNQSNGDGEENFTQEKGEAN